MKDKKFDAVRMMREIRDKLSKKYGEAPEDEKRDLQDIRKKYGIEVGLIGLWKDREDIEDSAAYARQLREQAQRRQGRDGTEGVHCGYRHRNQVLGKSLVSEI